jgi:cytochrome c
VLSFFCWSRQYRSLQKLDPGSSISLSSIKRNPEGVMRRIVLLSSIFLGTSAFAETVSKEEMIKYVQEGVAHCKKVGKDVCVKDFTSKAEWKRKGGELYMYCYDMKGINLCHGAKAVLVGQDLSGMKDKKGLFLIQALRDKAKKDGKGFVEFYWENPTSKKVEHKLGYTEKVDDNYFIGSGIYIGG